MTQPPPVLWRWQTHRELPSTQDAAIDAARSGDLGRLAILAARQTAGRGCAGRAWVAPEGNLNLSLLLRPQSSAVEAGRWALVAGIAVRNALAAYTPGLTLKWPNDILLNGAKLAGILIDSEMGQEPQPTWLVIGIGANLAAAPEIPGRETAHLPAPAPTPQTVAESVVAQLDAWSGQTTADIIKAWLAHAHPVGTLLHVQTPTACLSGQFAGLAPTGELLLLGHQSPISSAEIALC